MSTEMGYNASVALPGFKAIFADGLDDLMTVLSCILGKNGFLRMEQGDGLNIGVAGDNETIHKHEEEKS